MSRETNNKNVKYSIAILNHGNSHILEQSISVDIITHDNIADLTSLKDNFKYNLYLYLPNGIDFISNTALEEMLKPLDRFPYLNIIYSDNVIDDGFVTRRQYFPTFSERALIHAPFLLNGNITFNPDIKVLHTTEILHRYKSNMLIYHIPKQLFIIKKPLSQEHAQDLNVIFPNKK